MRRTENVFGKIRYFPTQKRLNTAFTISSRAVRPVSSPTAFRASSNFLIDASGNIVAKNLRGEDLYKKVEELLGK